MPTLQNQNMGGYQGTGQTGTFGGITYNAPTATSPYGSYTPQNAQQSINSSSIAPVAPIQLPNATPSNFGGLQGATEAIVAQAQANQANQTQPSAQDNYLKAILEQGNISSSVDRTEQDTAKKESDRYLAQLEQEQLANRRRIEALQKNPEGMLASGVSIETERLNRESLSKQADIAILQTAANRNYDTAASIADRQVALKLEKSAANLEALKLLDQREYGEITRKKEREYKKQEDTENAIKQLKLNVAQYGGGLSLLNQLSAIDTTKPDAYDKAVRIAGKYASDPLDRQIKQAQLGKLRADALEVAGGGVSVAVEPGKKPTGKADFVSAGFANRAAEAKGILDRVETERKGILTTGLFSNRKAPNVLKSKDLQQYQQAQENFLRAVLRKESGAAIGKDEMEGYAPVYFAMPGDSKEVILQKQRARVDALNSLIGASGKAYGGTFLSKPTKYLGVTARDTTGAAPISEDSYANSLLQTGGASSFNYFEPK